MIDNSKNSFSSDVVKMWQTATIVIKS